MCIFAARSHDKKYIYVKNTYNVKANLHLVWACVYMHMCKLTFSSMQLRSHAQKYTRVQIIHICKIYIPCVNQRMWTGLKLIHVTLLHMIIMINFIYSRHAFRLTMKNTMANFKNQEHISQHRLGKNLFMPLKIPFWQVVTYIYANES